MLDSEYLIYLCLAGAGLGCCRALRRMRPHVELMRRDGEARDEAARAELRGTIIGTTAGGIAGGVVFGVIAGTLAWLVAGGVVAMVD